MKKALHLLILTLSTLLLLSCHQELDQRIADLTADVEELEGIVSKLNTNINALSDLVSALEKNDHISGITEFMDGGQKAYRITFTSGSTLVLTSGTNGVTPIVGVRYNEQYEAYYWTIQMGESGTPTWMTNSYGLRVKATGTVPQLKIEDGIWWYSFDGTSWNKAGWGPAQGEPGTSVFSSIDTSDPYFVSFIIGDYNIFRLPTQFAFDELTRQCEELNNEFQTYTDLVNKIPGDTFVKSVTEFEENGVTGCRITLENGKILTIRNGYSSQDSVLLSAKAYTDGKYYWVYRSRSTDAFEWLRYKGEMISVSYEDVTPVIGITESKGVFYFTISYAGGETEIMKGPDGKPVEATGKVVLDFFTAADLSDPTAVILTMADGTVVRLPRTREYVPTLSFSFQYPYVVPETKYRYQMLVMVKDTLSSKEVLPNYVAYQQASNFQIDAIAVDNGGYVESVVNTHFSATAFEAGVAYDMTFDVRFTTGSGADWDISHKFRVAVFLTWLNSSVMKVADFYRLIPATELILTPTKITLQPGKTFQLNHTFRPANSTDPTVWSSSDPAIATVSNAGLVTAVAEGTCTITIQKGSLKQTCECTVEAATP